jgi:hypothetical protein
MSTKQEAARRKQALRRKRQANVAKARAAQAEQRRKKAEQALAGVQELQPAEPPKIRISPTGCVNRRDAALVVMRSVHTLENWACRGVGPPFILVGGRAAYDLSELLAWRGSEDGRTVQP